MSQPIYHLLRYAQWQAIAPGGLYAPDSLETDGFVHFSGDEATLLAVANAYHHDTHEPLAVLKVDPDLLTAKVRWEPPSELDEDQLFPHVYGAVEHSAVLDVRHLRRGPDGRYVAVVDRPPTAKVLDLVPHPDGGWYRETWKSPVHVHPAGYPTERPAATAILYLLRPDEESMWHRVRSDELWLWHSGGPLELTLGGTSDEPGLPDTTILGPDFSEGHQPQLVVPANCWQSAKPAGNSEVLVSCVVAPGSDYAEVSRLG